MTPILAPAAADPADEISALIDTLLQSEKRLEELTAGEVDSVSDGQGRIVLLRRAQDQLRGDNAARQTAILNSLPASIALIDGSGRIVSVNGSWRRFGAENGLARDDHGVGDNYLSVCDAAQGKDSREAGAAAAGIRAVLAGRVKSFALEYPCDSPDQQRCFLMTATPLVLRDREEGVVVTHFDISEQKVFERSVRESEERFRATFEQAAVGMVHTAPDGRFLRVNDQYCAITGYTRSELLGMNIADLVAPEHLEGSADARATLLAGARSTHSAERRHVRKDRSLVWVRIVTTLLRDAKGLPKYFITVVEDVTERKLAARRLERINRLYAVLTNVGAVIARIRDPRRLYEAVCRSIVDDGLLQMCAVVEADSGTGRLAVRARHGAVGDYFEAVGDLTEPGMPRNGTIGTAIRTGQHEVCNDVATDPRMATWRAPALRHIFQSVASFPLKSGSATIGALVLFAGETGYFQDDEIRLMDAVAEDVSLAVESLASAEQRQRAEEGLRRTQAMLASAVRIAGLGSWDYDLVNDRHEWSDEALEIFGVRREDFGGDLPAFMALVHPEDQAIARRRTAPREPGHGAGEIEYRIIRPDGEVRILYDRGVVSCDAAGAPTRATGMVMDITERRRAEQALRHSDERFKRVFNQQFQITVILSLDGRVLEVNDLPLRIGGVAREDVVGKLFWDTVWVAGLPQARASWSDLLAIASSQDDPVLREGQLRRADGELRDVDVAITAVKDAGGGAEYFILQGVDVTDRKLGEAQARARLALLKTAGHTARLGGWCLDIPDLRVTWTDEIFAIFERPPGSMPTLEEAIKCYAPEWREAVGRAVDSAIKEGTPFDLEVQCVTASGRRLWVRAVGDAERGADGSVVRVQGALQDISERREAESERAARWKAEEASKAKSTFLATMSHEIRTPMNGVLGLIEVLCQTSLDKNQLDMVELIRDSAFSLLGIIDGILDFSKIEAGKLEIDNGPLSVAELVEAVCEMQYPMATKRGVDILPYVDPAIPAAIVGDAGRLRQVLVNLVNNAIKFSSAGTQRGEVTVRAVMVDDAANAPSLEFRIVDNGIGMSAEVVECLFTSFNQADASTTRRFGGTGLGLAISRRLAELMGGTIAVTSVAGKGSTFTVRLPLVPCAREHESPIEPDIDGVQCTVVTGVLQSESGASGQLAEDVVDYLRHVGAEVTRVTTAAEAAALESVRTGASVWVLVSTDPEDPASMIASVAASIANRDVRLVAIRRGSRRAPQAEAGGIVRVDRNVMHRRTLVAAVAIAAGRGVLEDHSPQSPRHALLPRRRAADERADQRLILVVEDNEINQQVILRQLNLLGYGAQLAGSGTEALELLRRGEYALILTDLQMPDLDGYDLTRLVRAEERAGLRVRVPIIALTANALHHEVVRCLAVGMDDYLTKPATLVKLQETLEHWWPRPDPPAATRPVTAAAPVPAKDGALLTFDVRVLAALVGDEPAVITDFLQEFRRSSDATSKALAEARAAASAQDIEASPIGSNPPPGPWVRSSSDGNATRSSRRPASATTPRSQPCMWRSMPRWLR